MARILYSADGFLAVGSLEDDGQFNRFVVTSQVLLGHGSYTAQNLLWDALVEAREIRHGLEAEDETRRTDDMHEFVQREYVFANLQRYGHTNTSLPQAFTALGQ